VELRALQPASELRVLELGATHELLAEVRAEPGLCVPLQRAELDDREHPSAAADALAAIEHRQAAGERADDREHEPDRHRDDPEEQREEDVEDSQLDIDTSLRRGSCQRLEARDERLGGPRRRLHGPMLVALRAFTDAGPPEPVHVGTMTKRTMYVLAFGGAAL